MRRIAVVYDVGAASVAEIVAALAGLAEPIFVCPESEHGEQLFEDMAEFGRLCRIDGLGSDEAVAKLRAERPAGIVTFSEYQLERTALLARALDLPFHSPEVAQRLTHKSLQRKALNECGASAVPSRLVTDRESAMLALEDIGLPAVFKPEVGTGSRSTYRVCSPDELDAACREVFVPDGEPCSFVLEGELRGTTATEPWGDYVSVESAVSEGDITHLAVTGKFPLAPPFRETGSFLPAELADAERERVRDVVTRALKGLGLQVGVCHTEVKLTPSGPQVIEVNGRLGGRVNALLGLASGVDVIRLAARIALAESDAVNQLKDIEFHRIAFMYAHVPPVGARRVTGVQGVDRLYGLPGITHAKEEGRPGDATDWRMGRLGHVYTCFGVTADYVELTSLLDEIRRTVEVGYE